jgi:molybdopterin-guanine dinucleotide biosynthesis protein A
VIACDLPLVTPEMIERLSRFATDGVDAVIPTQRDGRLQPLCAFYRTKRCLAAAGEILSQDRPTPPLHTIAAQVNAMVVKFDQIDDLLGANDFFLNANRPEDIQRGCEIVASKR